MVEEPQVVMHEADEPDAVADLFDADGLTGERLAETDLFAELGERIGVTRQTIAAIEAGKYSPTLETAFKIAEVFEKPLEEIFQWKLEDR